MSLPGAGAPCSNYSIAEALRRPVTITKRNKPRLVLLSIEDYRKLTARAAPRMAGRLESMPDELFGDVKQAVDRL